MFHWESRRDWKIYWALKITQLKLSAISQVFQCAVGTFLLVILSLWTVVATKS